MFKRQQVPVTKGDLRPSNAPFFQQLDTVRAELDAEEAARQVERDAALAELEKQDAALDDAFKEHCPNVLRKDFNDLSLLLNVMNRKLSGVEDLPTIALQLKLSKREDGAVELSFAQGEVETKPLLRHLYIASSGVSHAVGLRQPTSDGGYEMTGILFAGGMDGLSTTLDKAERSLRAQGQGPAR